MTDAPRKRARTHPAMGGRFLAAGLSFSVALGILSKLVADRPVLSESTTTSRAEPAVAAALPKVIVRVVHRHLSTSTSRTTATYAGPRTVRRVVRPTAAAPAPQPVTQTHAS